MTTHVHAPVLKPKSEIAEQAREIHPFRFTGKLVLTTIAAVFISLGWIAGALWFAAAFSVLWTFNRVRWTGQCIRLGYHTGARSKLVPKEHD